VSFFAELKRRNVFRVGIAYVITGWLLAQVAEFAFENFGAPDWALRTFVIFLLLGLPLVLFVAWAFEVTPEGIKLEKNVDRSKSITTTTGRKLDRLTIGVLAIAVAFLLVDKFFLSERVADVDEIVATESQSIAVLPFVNMSGDNDYFADGLSEELLNLLAKIPDLKVAGRTSSFAFKGRNEDLREIGEALSVTKVLEGSVRRSGERLRVTAQLINVEDGYHIWSETYDRQMADIFDIQDDVAGAITDALQLHLTPQSDRLTKNAEAYALYLEALALQVYASADDLYLAQNLLDEAIALDPRFASAYELKAAFFWYQSGWLIDAPIGQKLAYDAASKALDLDPTLAGARSFALTAHPNWNWTMEFEALDQLLLAEPNNISALGALTWDMVIVGYFDESVRLAQKIIDLEPLSALGYWRKGDALLAAGRQSEAHTFYKRAAELGNNQSIFILGADYLIQGDDASAINWFEQFFTMLGLDSAEVSRFIENVRDPDTGKAFLDQWIEAEVAAASNLNERIAPYSWYLYFGHLDDYWLALESFAGGKVPGWTNVDLLEHDGIVYRRTGFTKHPKYIQWATRSSIVDLWDKRGPPDHCSKASGEWVCE
jgi:TolB-like protein